MRDGEQVELINGVHLKALDGSGLVITGARCLDPNDDLLVLQGSPSRVNAAVDRESANSIPNLSN